MFNVTGDEEEVDRGCDLTLYENAHKLSSEHICKQ